MPTQIHELKGVMTAESKGLLDGLDAIARFAMRAASAWEKSAARIELSATKIESVLNRGSALFDDFGQAASAAASRVSGAAAGMASAWNAAVGSMRQSAPTANVRSPSTRLASGGGGSTAGARSADAQANSALALAQAQARGAAAAGDYARAEEILRIALDGSTASANRQQSALNQLEAAQRRQTQSVFDAQRAQAQATAQAVAQAKSDASASAATSRQAASQMISHAKEVASAWTDAFSRVLSAATRIATVITGIVAAIGGSLVKMGTTFNDTITRTDISLTKLTGSANVSKAMLGDLQKLAIDAQSFKFGDLAPLAVSLINAKFAAKDVVPLIRLIGDQVAAIGGTQQSFDRIVLAITQIQQKGRFTAQEANQLAEAGISPWQAIADAMGKTVAEVRAMSEKGQIDSRTALNAIFADMQKAAGAMKATASATVGGLMSSFADLMEQWAGKVTMPVYEMLRKSLTGLLSSLESPQFAAFTETIYAQFTRLSLAVQRFFGGLGGDPWAVMSEGARRLTTVIVDGIGAFERLLPTLASVAGQVAAVVEWFARLAVENPRLTAALVALQVTGLLGINAAIGSVIKALMSLIGFLAQAATGAASTGAALQTLGTTAGAAQLALGGIVAIGLAVFLYEVVDVIQDLNTQLTKSIELQEKFRKSLETQTKAKIGEAAKLEGGDQISALESELAAAEKRSQDAAAEQRRAQSRVDSVRSTTWGQFTEFVEGTATANLSEAKSLAAAAEEQYAAIKAELERVKNEQAVQAGKAEIAAQPDGLGLAPGESPLGGGGIDPKAAAARAKAKEMLATKIEDSRRAQIAKDAKSYDELREFMDLGPSTDQLKQFAATLPGFTADIVKQLGEMFDASKALASDAANPMNDPGFVAGVDVMAQKAATEANQVVKKDAAKTAGTESFDAAMGQLNLSGASDAVIYQATTVFNSLTDALLDGTMTVDDYEQRVKSLTKGMQNIVGVNPADIAAKLEELSASDATIAAFQQKFAALQQDLLAGTITVAQFKDGVATLEKRLQTAGQAEQQFAGMLDNVARNLPSGAVDHLKMKFEELQNAMLGGAIGLDDFKKGMRELEEQARMADLQRKAAGQFTPEEFQRAILERAAGIQQQAFGQRVDEAIAQQLLNAGMTLEQVAKLMGKLPDKFDKMLAQQKSQTQTVDSGWAQRTATFYSWLNSFDGQVTSLRNQIAMMSQNLAPGVLDTTRERLRYVDQIAKLTSQLNQVLAPRTPIVRQTEADFLRDPNLAASGGGTTVNVSLPNVRVDSPSAAYEIGNAVAREQQRRGKFAYN